MVGVLYLAVYVCAGNLILRFLLPSTPKLDRIWLGTSLGVFLMMWLPTLMAFLFRFSVFGHMLALVPLILLVVLCKLCVSDRMLSIRPRLWNAEDKKLLILLCCTALPLTLLGGFLQYTHGIRYVDGTYHVGQSTYGDLPLHLGIISSLRNAAYPPDYSILPGERLTYPFLSDSFSTTLMLFGMNLECAYVFAGVLMSALVFSGYVLLCYRITGRRSATVLACLFFFLNGGFGFLYSLDTLGVSNGTPQVNSLQSGTWGERLNIILNGWYQTPINHAEQSYYNLRFSNIIADMFVPQRTFLGGWSILLPCVYLLYHMVKKQNMPNNPLEVCAPDEQREQRCNEVLLGCMAGGLPLIHTHSFAALGLLSLGWMLWDLLHGGRFKKWLVYGLLAVLLAAPQLLGWTFRHAVGNSRFAYFQFNWVNNAGEQGLRDGYLFFYIKNLGVPFLLLLLALFQKEPKGRFLLSGAFLIFAVAELIVFQPNEYDNNKLFYVWWAVSCIVAADFAVQAYHHMRFIRARAVLAAALVAASIASGTLSLARECVSDYQMFSEEDILTAEYVEENTSPDAVFLCWTQHINPVSALAGRRIVCGPGLWLYYHGYDLTERERDIRTFFDNPEDGRDILEKYHVDYIYLSSYEENELGADPYQLSELYPEVYTSLWGDIHIYSVQRGDQAGG